MAVASSMHSVPFIGEGSAYRSQFTLACLAVPCRAGGGQSRLAWHAPPRSGSALKGRSRSGPIAASRHASEERVSPSDQLAKENYSIL